MLNYNFVTERVRFDLKKENTLVFTGWFREDNPKGASLECYLDKEPLIIQQKVEKNPGIRQKYVKYQAEVNEEYTLTIKLPVNWERCRRITLYTCINGQKKVSYSASVKQLKKIRDSVDYYIEMQKLEDNTLLLSGWSIAKGMVKITVQGKNRRELPIEIERNYRRDVTDLFEEVEKDYQAGFKLSVDISKEEKIRVCFLSGSKSSYYETKRSWLEKGGNVQAGISDRKSTRLNSSHTS